MSSQIKPGTQGTGFGYSQDPSFSYFDVGTQDPLSYTDFPEFSGLSQVSPTTRALYATQIQIGAIRRKLISSSVNVTSCILS